MQRYTTREVDWHLLSFSIAKTSEKLLLNDRYSVSCGYEKTFQVLTLTFVRMEKNAARELCKMGCVTLRVTSGVTFFVFRVTLRYSIYNNIIILL